MVATHKKKAIFNLPIQKWGGGGGGRRGWGGVTMHHAWYEGAFVRKQHFIPLRESPLGMAVMSGKVHHT